MVGAARESVTIASGRLTAAGEVEVRDRVLLLRPGDARTTSPARSAGLAPARSPPRRLHRVPIVVAPTRPLAVRRSLLAGRRRLSKSSALLHQRALRAAPWLPRWWIWIATPILMALTWPVASTDPTAGLDASWRLALHLGAEQGLDPGSDLVFTYGPLGYLSVPLVADSSTTVPALLFMTGLHGALVASLLLAGRRVMHPALAIVAAYPVAWLMFDKIESALIVALLVGALAIQGAIPDRIAPWLLAAAGVATAILMLVKLNVGLGCIAIGVLAAGWLPPGRWRSIGAFLGAFLIGLVAIWVASGWNLLDIGAFFAGGLDAVAGYSAAMFFEEGGRDWEIPAVWALITVVAVLLMSELPRIPRPRAICLALAVGVFVFLEFKHGFVRHDLHSVGAFAAIAAVPLAVAWTAWRRVAAGILLAVAVVFAVQAWQTPGPAPSPMLSPGPRVEAAGEHLALLVSGSRREDHRDAAAAGMRAAYALPPAMLEAIGGGSVHVDPVEAGVVWAYGLRWAPVPVFQSYSAYTPRLDDLNAERLESGRAPEFVLRQPAGFIDGHLHEHESPRYQLELVCRYREQLTGNGWQLLRRADDRCGEPVELTSVVIRPGEPTPVPAPAPDAGPMIVAAEVHPEGSLVDRLRTALYRPNRRPLLTVDGRVTSVAEPLLGQPLMLSTPPAVWGTPGFPDQLAATSLAITGTAPGPLRVTFVGIPVRT
jgi:hypothetical protein